MHSSHFSWQYLELIDQLHALQVINCCWISQCCTRHVAYTYYQIIFRALSQGTLYTPGQGEQSGVLKDSMVKVYLGYRNIDEVLKLLKKNMN